MEDINNLSIYTPAIEIIEKLIKLQPKKIKFYEPSPKSLTNKQ